MERQRLEFEAHKCVHTASYGDGTHDDRTTGLSFTLMDDAADDNDTITSMAITITRVEVSSLTTFSVKQGDGPI